MQAWIIATVVWLILLLGCWLLPMLADNVNGRAMAGFGGMLVGVFLTIIYCIGTLVFCIGKVTGKL